MAGKPPPQAPPSPPPRSVGTSGSVYLLRAIASVMVIVAFLIYVLLIADSEVGSYTIGVLLSVVGLGLGIAGVWIGNIKIIKKYEMFTLNMVFLGIAVIFLVFGAVLAGSSIDTGHSIPIAEIVYLLLYGFLMLSFIELSHASYRFTDVDNYARSHELKGFSVGTVINNYFTWFGILMGIILLMGFLILATHYGLLVMINSTNEVFGSSLELNSIYVFAISVALWLIPLGIFASIVFGEGSLIKSTKTIFIKAERAPGEELAGLQTVEKPEDIAKR